MSPAPWGVQYRRERGPRGALARWWLRRRSRQIRERLLQWDPVDTRDKAEQNRRSA